MGRGIYEIGSPKPLLLERSPIQRVFASSGGSPLLTVAASDTPSPRKGSANYVCSGTADDVVINEAIQSAPSGATVLLLDGNFSLADELVPVDRLTLSGVGWATIVSLALAPSGTALLRHTGTVIDLGLRDMQIVGGGQNRWMAVLNVADRLRVSGIRANAVGAAGSGGGGIQVTDAMDCWVSDSLFTSVSGNSPVGLFGTRGYNSVRHCKIRDSGQANSTIEVRGPYCEIIACLGINCDGYFILQTTTDSVIRDCITYNMGGGASAGFRVHYRVGNSSVTTADNAVINNLSRPGGVSDYPAWFSHSRTWYTNNDLSGWGVTHLATHGAIVDTTAGNKL